MKHFRWIEAEKTKAKVGIQERYFGNINNPRAETRYFPLLTEMLQFS